jgi:UDP-N-acetylglucosamine 3-dehydrogenase
MLMVGHIERFNPAVIRLKQIIESGLLGKIVSMSTRRVGAYNPRIRDVGVILDIGVHDVDIISYLYGKKIDQVYTIAGADIHSSEDHASIHLRFDHEYSGLVDVNWLTPHKVRTLTAVGVEGVAYLDYLKQSVVLHDKEWVREAKVEPKEPLLNELQYFVRCVANNEYPHPNGEDGKHALEACMAAITSYHEEKVVDI